MPRMICLVLGLTIVACRDAVQPDVTTPAPLAVVPAHIARLAVVQDVSLLSSASTSVTLNESRFPTFASLLGHEAFRVEVDSLRRSLVGQYRPGMVRVTFLLRLRNQLDGTALIPPTFPTLPSRAPAILLFPVHAVALDQPGGISSVAPNELLITSPGGGVVTPSADWDGTPYDYFRGGPCETGNTCARFEHFAAPLAPLAVTRWQLVGYDVTPTVRAIRLRLVLAADLANAR